MTKFPCKSVSKGRVIPRSVNTTFFKMAFYLRTFAMQYLERGDDVWDEVMMFGTRR